MMGMGLCVCASAGLDIVPSKLLVAGGGRKGAAKGLSLRIAWFPPSGKQLLD